MEKFQNEVLRPILKLQNELLLAQAKAVIQEIKPQFNAFKNQVQRQTIKDLLQSNPHLRLSLIDQVVSLLTLSEFAFYATHKSESNKRITSMLIDRLLSQLERLY